MAAALATPAQRLGSVSAFFASQVRPGRLDIDVTVLRRGRSVSHTAAAVFRRFAAGVRVHAFDAGGRGQ